MFNRLSGFHIYQIKVNDGGLVKLAYASDSLCALTGYGRHELEEGYGDLVYEADRGVFCDYLAELAGSDGEERSAEYRLVKKDGSVVWLRDEAFFCDEKELKAAGVDVEMSGDADDKESADDKDDAADKDDADDADVKDGADVKDNADAKGKAEVVRKRMCSAGNNGNNGVERSELRYFVSVCMDVTQRYVKKSDSEMKRYISALSDVYDKIFEYNFVGDTVKCLYSNNSPVFKHFENVPMRLMDATDKWIGEMVAEEDSDRVRTFFEEFRRERSVTQDGKPHVIKYTAKSSDGHLRPYSGVFIKVDDDISLYCCRKSADEAADEALKNENENLKENMKRFVNRFADGAVAFKVTADGYAVPMYCSDNVCEFFGYTRSEWEKLMECGMSIEQFVAHCDTDYEEFEKLLVDGEGEFTYKDIRTGEMKNVHAICSQRSLDGNAPRYIMLYNSQLPSVKPGDGDRQVYIRTFGYFDVFVGDKPIAFKNKKSKELFALLVDRRGGFVTSDEAIGFLWEDETVNPVTLSRYRKVALRLKNTLESFGIADIVEAVDGKRRVDTDKVHCDLYDYLTGADEYKNLFKGSYLTNYSWGEATIAEFTWQA